jgi:hypothetical protein
LKRHVFLAGASLVLLTAAAVRAELSVRPLTESRAATAAQAVPRAKTDVVGARLLLPHYLVDKDNPAGDSTLFAVRNESSAPVTVEICYYENDRPQTAQTCGAGPFTLNAKQTRTVNVRDVPDLLVDDDGFARGFVLIEGSAPVLQGDYFQVTVQEAFADGDRLLNVDPASQDGDLCRFFTSRYLNGGAFDAGTTFTFWFQSEGPPDPNVPILFYSLYNEAGALIFEAAVNSDRVSFTEKAANLVSLGPIQGPNFGVIEFEFNQTVGYVGAVMSANGLYSAGIEAVCKDLPAQGATPVTADELSP